MIVGALDIGSNSIHLLIAEFVDGQIRPIQRYKEKVMLGAGFDEDQNLTYASMDPGLNTLYKFIQHVNFYNVEKLYCVATNTLRLANNRQKFIQKAEQILMHPIHVISGNTEARMIWRGVIAERGNDQTGLVIDIGGGSTEFARASELNNDPKTWSLQMGCVSYLEQFFTDHKINDHNIQSALAAAEECLATFVKELLPVPDAQAIGTAGTIESISVFCREIFPEDNGLIKFSQLAPLLDALKQHGSIEALPYDSLDDSRKQILPAGLCICCVIMEQLNIATIEYAESELCEGVLVEHLL